MAFNFNPLWKLLIDKGMKKTDLIKEVGLSRSTLAKMSKGEYVAMEVIDRLCDYFKCPIQCIMEHIKNND